MYTLDTNAIIYYFKNDNRATDILEGIFSQYSPVYISSITEVELFGFPDLSIGEEKQIENILSTLSIIPLDSRLAKIAGSIRRYYNLKTPDSIIAATAMFTNTVLITRNTRDFRRIPNIKLFSI